MGEAKRRRDAPRHRSPILDRLPTLDALLGERPTLEGYAEYCRETAAIEAATDDPAEQAAARLTRVFAVATIEAMEAERRAGAHPVDSLMLWPRIVGWSVICAFASVVRDDLTMRQLVPLLVEEFRHGCKLAAESCDRNSEAK